MFASIFIIIASAALFLYWFRHTCLLILAQRETSECALKVTSTIRLNFHQIEDVLQTAPPTALDRVHAGLEDDYRILTDLLQQASDTAGNILTLQAQDGSITVCGGCGCS